MLFSALDFGLFSSKYCRAHSAMSLELRRIGCLESPIFLSSSLRTLGVFKASAALESSATSAITNLPNSIVQLFLGLSSNFSCALANNLAMVLAASFLSIFSCCGSPLCSFSSPARTLPISSLACWRRLVGVLGNSIISASWGYSSNEVSESSSPLCLRGVAGNSTIRALGGFGDCSGDFGLYCLNNGTIFAS